MSNVELKRMFSDLGALERNTGRQNMASQQQHTVEDVLREFVAEFIEYATCIDDHEVTDAISEYAPKLRLAGEDETENERLLPCPFCGGKAEIHRWSIPNEENCAQVRCESITCGARGYEACECMTQSEVDEIAIAAWNRRAQ